MIFKKFIKGNACLRKEIKESKEAFDKTFAPRDEKFQSTLDSKDKDIKYYNSEIIIQRKIDQY